MHRSRAVKCDRANEVSVMIPAPVFQPTIPYNIKSVIANPLETNPLRQTRLDKRRGTNHMSEPLDPTSPSFAFATSANCPTVTTGRHERSLLAAEHKKLQQRFRKALQVCTVYACQNGGGTVEHCNVLILLLRHAVKINACLAKIASMNLGPGTDKGD
jgi:hypothetical protein